jgi:hypothetical protein
MSELVLAGLAQELGLRAVLRRRHQAHAVPPPLRDFAHPDVHVAAELGESGFDLIDP